MPRVKHPGRAFICFLGAGNYQLSARLSATDGYEFATRSILDTGSGPSLIRESLLPKGLCISDAGDLEDGVFFDVNGGLLPITGTVTLWVTVGTQRVPICFGVVRNMSVPVILGNTFIDHHTRNVCTEDQTVELKNGAILPILRGNAHRRKPRPNRAAVCDCSTGTASPLRLTRETRVPANSIAHIWVATEFVGAGLAVPKNALFLKHGLHLASGPVPSDSGRPFLVQVANPQNRRVKLPAGTKVGVVEHYEGSLLAVTQKMMDTLEKRASAPAQPVQPEVDLGNVPPELAERLTEILQRHSTLWDGTLGLMKQTQHRIQLKPGVTPVRQHPYKAGPRAREIERAEVGRMLKMGVIEPATSEWASPVVLFPKPDGTPRFCIDYRRLNEATVKDSYPLPRMDECLDSLGEARFFSTLDCNAGYWQIPVAEEDRNKTAFTCHHGAYRCVRLPFGLSNAPATFQRAMDMILAGVKWQTCLIYLDDVIVFSKTAEQHLDHLAEVLDLLAAAGVTLKATKCHFFQKEVEYLGHVVTPGRVAVNTKNTDALRRIRYPRTQTHLKSFLGMCGVYRKFVKDFANLARPLTRLTSTKLAKQLPPPTKEEDSSFTTLKEKLLSPPVLALPRLEGEYIVDVDASYSQLGCSLLQKQPDGEYHPVGYYSRALEERERNYCVTEIEGLGVVWAVTHLRPYLEGARFIVRCDHAALRSIFTGSNASGRITRWRLRLAEFDYELQHKPGRFHHVPDALSRLPTEGRDETPLDVEVPVLAVTRSKGDPQKKGAPKGKETLQGDLPPEGAGSSSAMALDPETPLGRRVQPLALEVLLKEQDQDPYCKRSRELINQGHPTVLFDDEHGVLCRRAPLDGSVQRVIPEKLHEELLRREHESPLAGHPGASRMYQTMRRRYYWPSMVAHVYAWVAKCTGCAKNRLHERRHTPLMRLFPATEPFSGLAMDLLGPFPETDRGYSMILVISDRFTKLTRALPLRETTALVVASAFIDYWVGAYGVPDTVLTDNGPQFASLFFQGVLGMLGIISNYTTPYHPQTNGQVERFNRTLIRQLRHYVSEHQRTWDRYLAVLTLAYNSQVHSSTGEIPLMFVSPRRLPTLALERMPQVEPPPGGALPPEVDEPDEEVRAANAKTAFVEHLKEVLPPVRRALARSQARYKKRFDSRVLEKNKSLGPGDWVYTDSHQKRKGKLSFGTAGPFMVIKTTGYLFTVETPKGLRVVSSDHVTAAPKPRDGDPAWARAAEALGPDRVAPPSERGGHEFVFERIVDHRWGDDDTLVLKLRWFGCPPEEDTWEPATSVPREHVRRYAKLKKIPLTGLARQGVLFNTQEREAALRNRTHGRETRRLARLSRAGDPSRKPPQGGPLRIKA